MPRLAKGERLEDISADVARRMIRDGVIKGGMIPKIETCLDAVEEGETRDLHIEITQAASITVSITDTGQGIKAPEQVFDPFYSTKDVGAAKGVGLGLSISYAIVQSVGGEIRAHNTDTGACFTVTLQPMVQERAA